MTGRPSCICFKFFLGIYFHLLGQGPHREHWLRPFLGSGAMLELKDCFAHWIC